MIVRNEERNLPRCLESLQGVADEICVVDTGSIDTTPEILTRFGVHTKLFPWNGNEADARNESLSLAHGRWVLIIDADEEITPELAAELKEKLPSYDGENKFHSLSFIQKDRYADGSSSLYRVIRLGRKHPLLQFNGRIHPRANFLGPAAELASALNHYGYIWTPEQRRSKAERILSSTREEVDQADASIDILCQHLTAAIIASDGVEMDKTLSRLLAHPSPTERLQNPYWSQSLTNLFQFHMRQDTLPVCEPLAAELLESSPLDVSAAFCLLQLSVLKREWPNTVELSRRVQAILHEPLRFGMLAFPELQLPCAEAWLWLAERALERPPTTPYPHHPRAIPSLCWALRNSSPTRKWLIQKSPLLQASARLLSPSASSETLRLLFHSLEKDLQEDPVVGMEHLLKLLLIGDVCSRLDKPQQAIRAAQSLIQTYPDHLWLMKSLQTNPFQKPFFGQPWENAILHLP